MFAAEDVVASFRGIGMAFSYSVPGVEVLRVR